MCDQQHATEIRTCAARASLLRAVASGASHVQEQGAPTSAAPPVQVLQRRDLIKNKQLSSPLVQVEWAARDSKLCAVVSDASIRVFDAAAGTQCHALCGHTGKLFEVVAHPVHAELLTSWARDGTVALWHAGSGRCVRQLRLADTYPGRGRWTDTQPLAVLEGCWSPSGHSLYVTDAAGQLHLFGFGAGDRAGRARYDQFFRTDYADLVVDPLTGTARGAATGRPPHVEADARLAISFDATPYEREYQQHAASNTLTRGARCPPLLLPSRCWPLVAGLLVDIALLMTSCSADVVCAARFMHPPLCAVA